MALALACAAVFLYERSKVALIIDDEAAWDLRDASPHKKVIITNDGIVARYACDGKGNDLVKAKGLELSERTFQDILEGCEEMLKSAS